MKSSIWLLLLYVTCGALSIFGGLVLYNIYQGKSSNQENRQYVRESEQNNNSRKATKDDANRESLNDNITTNTALDATPSVTPQSTPSPKSTPSLTKLDVTGTWTGSFANRDAILYINSQTGDSFSGILKNTKGAIVSVSGRINRETRQISIQENRVVQAAVEGPDWILGTNSGSLSADGQRMHGSGRDRAGHVYSFSFAKE